MSDPIDAIDEASADDLFDELHELITARFNEQITLKELKRLEYLIINSQQARQIYLLCMHDLSNLRRMLRANAANVKSSAARELDALRESILAHRLNVLGKAAGGSSDDAELMDAAQLEDADQIKPAAKPASAMHKRGKPAPVRRFKAAMVLLLLGLGTLAFLFLRGPGVEHVDPVDSVEQPQVAVLSEAHQALWEDDAGRSVVIDQGQTLDAQKLHLVNGVATIKLSGGTVLVLDARERATHFEFKKTGVGQLHLGRLTVHADASVARPYTIALPGDVHLGRAVEFGVVADESGRCEVHVMDGELEATQYRGDGQVTRRLKVTPQRAMVLQPAVFDVSPLTLSQSAFDQRQFIRHQPTQSIAESTRTREEAQLSHWESHLVQLRNDPALVYYLDGAGSGLGDDRLTLGRFGQKSAIHFARPGDEIVVPDEPSLRLQGDMTVAAWVHPERGRTRDFALVVGKGTGTPANIHEENRNFTLFLAPAAGGRPRFEWSINEQETQANRYVQSDGGDLRQWHLIVGVVRQGEMFLYCNGRLAAGPVRVATPKVSDDPLLIGRSHHPHIAAPFQGAIDMVAIFDRSMSAAEIHNLYTAGRP